MCKLNVSGIINESIVDGPGIRYVIFAQGCPHHCEGCHNPQTHPFEGGKEYDMGTILNAIKKNALLSGVTFSGGEPFCQAEFFGKLGEEIKKLNLNIVCYSGYTFEQLIDMSKKDESIKNLLNTIDILIDGKFEIEKKSLMLKFRGSSNQRILDIPNSIIQNSPVEIDILF